MAKRNLSVILALIVGAVCPVLSSAHGAGEADAPATSGARAERRSDKQPEVRRESPREPGRFHENRKVWENLPEEEREVLRRKAREMHQQTRRRVEEILAREGTQLNAAQREEFVKRYFEERREIERTLRQRMQEERERLEARAVQKIQDEILRGAKPGGESPEN